MASLATDASIRCHEQITMLFKKANELVNLPRDHEGTERFVTSLSKMLGTGSSLHDTFEAYATTFLSRNVEKYTKSLHASLEEAINYLEKFATTQTLMLTTQKPTQKLQEYWQAFDFHFIAVATLVLPTQCLKALKNASIFTGRERKIFAEASVLTTSRILASPQGISSIPSSKSIEDEGYSMFKRDTLPDGPVEVVIESRKDTENLEVVLSSHSPRTGQPWSSRATKTIHTQKDTIREIYEPVPPANRCENENENENENANDSGYPDEPPTYSAVRQMDTQTQRFDKPDPTHTSLKPHRRRDLPSSPKPKTDRAAKSSGVRFVDDKRKATHKKHLDYATKPKTDRVTKLSVTKLVDEKGKATNRKHRDATTKTKTDHVTKSSGTKVVDDEGKVTHRKHRDAAVKTTAEPSEATLRKQRKPKVKVSDVDASQEASEDDLSVTIRKDDLLALLKAAKIMSEDKESIPKIQVSLVPETSLESKGHTSRGRKELRKASSSAELIEQRATSHSRLFSEVQSVKEKKRPRSAHENRPTRRLENTRDTYLHGVDGDLHAHHANIHPQSAMIPIRGAPPTYPALQVHHLAPSSLYSGDSQSVASQPQSLKHSLARAFVAGVNSVLETHEQKKWCYCNNRHFGRVGIHHVRCTHCSVMGCKQ